MDFHDDHEIRSSMNYAPQLKIKEYHDVKPATKATNKLLSNHQQIHWKKIASLQTNK